MLLAPVITILPLRNSRKTTFGLEISQHQSRKHLGLVAHIGAIGLAQFIQFYGVQHTDRRYNVLHLKVVKTHGYIGLLQQSHIHPACQQALQDVFGAGTHHVPRPKYQGSSAGLGQANGHGCKALWVVVAELETQGKRFQIQIHDTETEGGNTVLDLRHGNRRHFWSKMPGIVAALARFSGNLGAFLDVGNSLDTNIVCHIYTADVR